MTCVHGQLDQCPILPSANIITISFGLNRQTFNITNVAQDVCFDVRDRSYITYLLYIQWTLELRPA